MSGRQNLKTILQSQVFVTFGTVIPLLVLMNAWFLNKSVESHQQSQFNALGYLSPAFVRFVSAGYWPAASDSLWIGTISQIGSGVYNAQTLEESRSFYRLATDLDPHFFSIYEQAAILFGFFHESAEAAEEILQKGIEHYERGLKYPQFWRRPEALYIYLGYTQAFVKQDWASARITFLRAAEVPNAPVYLQSMKQWLLTEGSERTLALKVLKILIREAKDETIRNKYLEKLKQYES